jgi:hypothetical protein
MSKFLDLIRKSYLVLETEGRPPTDAASGGNPFGGDAAGGAPAPKGAPDAAMTPETDPEADANSAEAQLKKNLDDLKQGIATFVDNLSKVVTTNPNSDDVTKLFSKIKELAITEKDSQKYIDKVIGMFNPSFSDTGYDDDAQYIAKPE